MIFFNSEYYQQQHHYPVNIITCEIYIFLN